MSLKTIEQQPEAIFVQLHTYCNANCINCPHDFTYKTIHQKGKMTDETWTRIINSLIEMKYKGQVGFYLHHEPLVDTSLFEKIDDVNNLTEAFVVLSTNAALLSQDKIDKLLVSRPRKVHININSGLKSEYEKSMGLNYDLTIKNIHNFITQVNGIIDIEINCPVMENYHVESLKELFPNVKVNLDYWANSRGGLLPDLYMKQKGSRFILDGYCRQPSQNFNILYDGSVIACCMDWMHESKKDFPNVNKQSIQEIYSDVIKLEESFKHNDYTKYKMCQACSVEMNFGCEKTSKPMKILITNHHLLDFTGSEIYTLTLADYLQRFGHSVTVYSKFVDMMGPAFEKIGVRLVTDLEHIKGEAFDIAHIHHQTSAYEIRYFFPQLPMIFLSHGVIPFLEQPPHINLNISKYVAVSEEVRDNLIKKINDSTAVEVVRNIVDASKFVCNSPINNKLKKALILSNKIDNETEEIIRGACNELGVSCEFIGMRFKEISQEELPAYINDADIVFSLGRGVIETMFCGRLPFVLDCNGGDGFVTPDNFNELMSKNFSGRAYNKKYDKAELINALRSYNAADAAQLYELTLNYFSPELIIKRLVKIYNQAIEEQKNKPTDILNTPLIESIYNMIFQTKIYTERKEQRNVKNTEGKNYDNTVDSNKPIIEQNKSKNSSVNFNALISLFQIQLKQENLFDAYLLLQKILKEDPNYEPALKLQENLYEHIQKKCKEKAWNAKKSASALINAEKQIEKQNLEEAKIYLYEIVNYEPEHIEALNDLAVVEILEGKFDFALELLNEVLKLAPGNQTALDNIVYIKEKISGK